MTSNSTSRSRRISSASPARRAIYLSQGCGSNHEQISLENDIPVCPAAGDSSQFDVARRRRIALEVSIVADLRHGKQVLHECIRVRLAGALGFGPRAVGLPFCLGRVQRLGSR